MSEKILTNVQIKRLFQVFSLVAAEVGDLRAYKHPLAKKHKGLEVKVSEGETDTIEIIKTDSNSPESFVIPQE